MGEIVQVKGDSFKLGTCEDLYYIRHHELEELDALGAMDKQPGNLNPAEYLEPRYGFRYRFPFPNEDGQDIREWQRRSHTYGLTIAIPRNSPLANMDHAEICRGVSLEGTYNVNVMFPCPGSPAFKGVKSSPLPDTIPLRLVQQKAVEGELWAVIECGWCGNKVRLPREEAVLLAKTAREQGYFSISCGETWNAIFWDEVANRIMAGYKA